MASTPRRRALLLGIAAALLTAASGCTDEVAGEATAASPTGSSPSTPTALPSGAAPSTEPVDALAAGLLPAEAFGPDAQVTSLDADDLADAGPGGLPPGGTVTPAECAQGLGAVQPTPEDLDSAVALAAATPTVVTVELLAEDDGIDAGAAAGFEDLLTRCARVTLGAPDGTSATVDFRALDVPDVGEASGGIAFTVSASATDGSSAVIPCLLAVAVDGRRLVFLEQVSADGAPLDEAAFADLFEQAFEAQQDA